MARSSHELDAGGAAAELHALADALDLVDALIRDRATPRCLRRYLLPIRAQLADDQHVTALALAVDAAPAPAPVAPAQPPPHGAA